MLNFRNLIICCVLLVAVKATVDDAFEEHFKNFQDALEYQKNIGFPMHDFDNAVSIRKNSLPFLGQMKFVFKKECLKEYETGMGLESLSYDSEKKDLALVAYRALERVCRKTVQDLKSPLLKGELLRTHLDDTLRQQDILHFLATYYNHGINEEDLSREAKKFMKKSNKTMSNEGAILKVIFEKFNAGKIRVDYPKPIGTAKKYLGKVVKMPKMIQTQILSH